jgi:hypothetical protein
MVLKASTPAPTLAPLAPAGSPPAGSLSINIIPASCALFRAGSGHAEDAAANQVVVMSWPFVTLDDAAVQRVLDGVYGAGAGGEAVLRAAVESQSPPAASGAAVQSISAPPNFIASGWMPEPAGEKVANGRRSRGTLWLAFGWPVAVNARASRNFGLRVLSSLTGIPIKSPGSGSEGFNALDGIGTGGIPQVAVDKSDVGLQGAAIQSALIAIAVILSIGVLLGAGPFAKAVATAQTTRQFKDAVAKLRAALQAMQNMPSLVQQAETAVAVARDATAETCEAATAGAGAAVRQLTTAKEQILAANAAAQLVVEYALSEANPDGSKIVREIRDQVLATLNASLAVSPLLAVAKEYVRCLAFQAAQRSLESQLRGIASEFATGQSMASAVLGGGAALSAAVAQADAAIAAVEAAREKFCPAWYMKELLGLPTYAWLGGGATVLIGGALVIKARRKRAAAPKPNRHRRRTSRRLASRGVR